MYGITTRWGGLVGLWMAVLPSLYATHNRAGEITYRQLGQTTYEVTLITYTDSRSTQADRPQIDLLWGDNTQSTIPRSERRYLGNFVQYNRYTDTHTYPGPGRYVIQFFDPNRVAGINNISNSVNIPFYVETELIIDPFQGVNNSPVLLQPPIDFAQVGVPFVHYPNGYDPDGDSIAYRFTVPKQNVNMPVPGYFDPPASDHFSLDPYTGRLEWDAPTTPGIYNIAIQIEEYRNGRRIGYIVRDMQIIVAPADNHPPVIAPLTDTCVLGGDSLSLDITASDTDTGQYVFLQATGGPFEQSVTPARLEPAAPQGLQTVSARFTWRVACESIRKRPYRVVIRAVDDHPFLPLADLKHFDIKVVGPPPRLDTLEPAGRTLTLRWQPPAACHGPELKGFYIYRREDSSGWTPGACETGAPGFQRVAFLKDPTLTAWTDSNGGAGLYPGRRYCYRLTAIYQGSTHYEPAEGQASNERCFVFSDGVPLLTQASVISTHSTEGKTRVRWYLPPLDTTQWTPPYVFTLRRGRPPATLLARQFTSYADYLAADTVLIDSTLNTEAAPYEYEAQLKATVLGRPLTTASGPAQTPFLTISTGNQSLQLRWTTQTPWQNYETVIYRLHPDSSDYEPVALVPSATYWEDTGLEVGRTYCYFVETHGRYPAADPPYEPFINLSQRVCAVPRDTIPPCPPTLSLVAFCEMEGHENIVQPYHRLFWYPAVDTACVETPHQYGIYFRRTDSSAFERLAMLPASRLEWEDRRDSLVFSAAGCYYVTALDEFGNESRPSNFVCADNCPRYVLPNVMTPNGDGFNDTFRPIPPVHFVQRVVIHIFDRWGRRIFTSEDPFFAWDGTDVQGRPMPEGVYYYHCTYETVFLHRPEPVRHRLQGTIQLIR